MTEAECECSGTSALSGAARRNLNLDLLKLIACAAVIGLHIYVKEDNLVSRTLYFLCTPGVPIFFMCSGYLLLDRQHFTRRYIAGKLLAIARVAILWSIIAAVVKAGGLWYRYGSFAQMAEAMGSPLYAVGRVLLLGLQDQGIMFVMWYLAALFMVYLTLPIVSLLIRGRDGHTSPLRVLILWGCLAAVIVLSRLVSFSIGRMLQNRVWLTWRIWTYWQFLLLGVLLKYAQPWIRTHIPLRAHLCFTLVITAAAGAEFVCVMRYLIANAWASTAYDSLAMILWVSGMFTLVSRFTLSPAAEKAVRKLAPLTMGVYLVHPIFLEVIDGLFQLRGFCLNIVYYVLLLGLSFAASWCLKKLPGGRWLTSL